MKTVSSVVRYFIVVTLAVAVALLIRTFVAEPYIVPTGSMLPTIKLEDRLVGEKITYLTRTPQAGEVITFAATSFARSASSEAFAPPMTFSPLR